MLALLVPTALMALPAQTGALAQATDEVRSIRLRLEERNAAIRTVHLENVFWIDRETGDVVRMERSYAVVDYGNFVVRDGLRFPTRISSRTVATDEVVALEVDHVELNGPIDPALFATLDPSGHP